MFQVKTHDREFFLGIRSEFAVEGTNLGASNRAAQLHSTSVERPLPGDSSIQRDRAWTTSDWSATRQNDAA
jgi:hypothetical protein